MRRCSISWPVAGSELPPNHQGSARGGQEGAEPCSMGLFYSISVFLIVWSCVEESKAARLMLWLTPFLLFVFCIITLMFWWMQSRWSQNLNPYLVPEPWSLTVFLQTTWSLLNQTPELVPKILLLLFTLSTWTNHQTVSETFHDSVPQCYLLFILKDTCPSFPLHEGFYLFEVTCKHFYIIQTCLWISCFLLLLMSIVFISELEFYI